MANGFIKTASINAAEFPLVYSSTIGRVTGHSRMAVYGHRAAPVAGDDIWEGGGAYPFLTVASKLEILSASANDTAAGTGARTFNVMGLDANFNQITEVITMNGVTPVVTVNSFLRVNTCNIASAGSGNTNAGDVTLRVQGAGSTQAIARAGYGFAKSCVFTVPNGFTLLVTDILPECGGNGNAANIIMGFTRINSNGLLQTTNEYNAIPGSTTQRTVITGATITGSNSLTLRVKAVAGAPTDAYCSVNGILVDNNYLT